MKSEYFMARMSRKQRNIKYVGSDADEITIDLLCEFDHINSTEFYETPITSLNLRKKRF